ncbi:hypothetical protein KI688_006734 [Linnemannia hyalina]|uniref:WLM domain-containing protein n=1 Tax=Linnemannia hyalina TaxID=64524 RepID=A0A9P7XK23_9FUNG|nr:hypothetical protein KI688_006734 [Linnemannia hyalina]
MTLDKLRVMEARGDVISWEYRPPKGNIWTLQDIRDRDCFGRVFVCGNSEESYKLMTSVVEKVKVIMRRRRWYIDELHELDPGSKYLGLNVGHTLEIHLKLRTWRGLISHNDLVLTMLHELAHIINSSHNDAFYDLFYRLKAEYETHYGVKLSTKTRTTQCANGVGPEEQRRKRVNAADFDKDSGVDMSNAEKLLWPLLVPASGGLHIEHVSRALIETHNSHRRRVCLMSSNFVDDANPPVAPFTTVCPSPMAALIKVRPSDTVSYIPFSTLPYASLSSVPQEILDLITLRTVETTDPTFISFLGLYHLRISKLESLTLCLKEHPALRVREFINSSDLTVPATMVMGQEFVDVSRCVSPVINVQQDNRFISLDLGRFRYKDGLDGFADLVSAFPTTHLEKLQLSFLNSIPHDKCINDGSNKDLNLEDVARFNQFFREPFRALKEIAITCGSQNSMDHTRLAFLTRCPNVKTLCLHRLDIKAVEMLPVCLGAACHKLSSLEWRKSLYNNADEILALIRTARSGWRESRLPDMPLFGTFTFSALMKNVETLEVLQIESAEELEMNAFVDVLCSARNLRRLEGIANGQRKRFRTEILVHAMTELEELMLDMQDLGTRTMEYAGVDPSMNLAAMEEAALLKDTRMFNYQFLEFSLESGLYLLAGLKELRMLDLRSTVHYIGVAELEWMHTNWPKLERIKGLKSDRRWFVYHADGPAAKAAVEKWMAAHPHGIGSSFYSSP